MSRTAEIRLTIDLDENNVPTEIFWEASEAKTSGPISCQSMMLSLWDTEQKSIAAIDLWSKDTTVDDMNLYFIRPFIKWQIPTTRQLVIKMFLSLSMSLEKGLAVKLDWLAIKTIRSLVKQNPSLI